MGAVMPCSTAAFRTPDADRQPGWLRCSTFMTRSRLVLPLAVSLLCPATGQATTCGAEIARIEALLNQARANRQVVPSAAESTAARLHHQPTPATVGKATTEAEEKLAAALATARTLDSAGKDAECLAALKDVAIPLGVR